MQPSNDSQSGPRLSPRRVAKSSTSCGSTIFSAARQRADDLLDTEWKVWADCDDEILGATQLRELAAAALPEVAGFRFGYDYARDAGGSSTCYMKTGANGALWSRAMVGRVHEVQDH